MPKLCLWKIPERLRAQKTDVISPTMAKKSESFTTPHLQNVDGALKLANSAQKEWADVPMKERTKVMFNFRQILMQDLDEISHLKSSESGKSFAEGKAGLLKGIEVLEFAIALQNMDLSGKSEVSRGVTCEYRREPVGSHRQRHSF